MSAVTIAVGGRWREIEDDNSDLRSKLAISEAQISMQRSELEDASEKLRCATSEMDILQRENASKAEEMNALKDSLRASKAEIAEMTISAEFSASMIGRMNSQQDASSEQIESLRLELQERFHELGQFKSQLASKEQALQLELTLKKKAEAKHQLCHAELCTLESRYAKQGSHVQLLLRDKERLWSQLARCRGSERKEQSKQDEPVEAVKKVVDPHRNQANRLRKSSTSRKNYDQTNALPSVTELERKLWHTQKALERERAVHEATKAALGSLGHGEAIASSEALGESQ
eukprot:s1015_g12.t1